MKYTFGKRVEGRTVYIPKALLTESVPGMLYEIQVETEGIPEDKRRTAAELLMEKLHEKFLINTSYVEVGERNIVLQVEGSPFTWSLVLAFLPEILTTIGVIVSLVSVFLIIAEVPTWKWLMLLIGILLAWFAPSISEWATGKKIEVSKKLKELRGEK